MSDVKPSPRKKKSTEQELFSTLLELQRRNLVLSQWAIENTLEQRAVQMQQEVEELLIEIRKYNPVQNHTQNTKESTNKNEIKDSTIKSKKALRITDEVGDVLWDCLGTLSRAEHEGLFKIEDVLQHIYKKFAERKPFLIENRKVSREEESRVWHEAKAKQKKEQEELEEN